MLLSVVKVNAQKNTFEFGVNKNFPKNDFHKKYKHKNNYETPSSVSLEFRYSRKVSNNFSIFAQYVRLPTQGQWLYATVRINLAEDAQGKLINHCQYNFFDLGVQYNFFKHKQHCISANSGISVAYGKDQYLVRVVWLHGQIEPYYIRDHLIYSETRYEMATYWGAFGGLKYDYLFWKRKINIGPEFAARYYTNGFPYQFSYGLHIGFNF